MKLTFNEIIALTKGVVRSEIVDEKLCLYRFTEAQTEAYKGYSENFHMKTFASAGIRIEFVSDSSSLSLQTEVSRGSSILSFGFDVYSNGALVKGFNGNLKKDCDTIPFSFDVALGSGTKTVCIYLPWSVQAKIISLSLDDGATFSPVEKKLKMISFGDSITHGYNAVRPSFSYASRLADALCADAVNKGIGGEKFFPKLAENKDSFEPDIITVAYGTNDWKHRSRETFERDCKAFYEKLSANYPDSKIFAIIPVWRGNCETEVFELGEFSNVANYIKKITAPLCNVTFIDGIDFIPHEKNYFAPDVLHPNDEGFRHYAYNLYAEIKKYL